MGALSGGLVVRYEGLSHGFTVLRLFRGNQEKNRGGIGLNPNLGVDVLDMQVRTTLNIDDELLARATKLI